MWGETGRRATLGFRLVLLRRRPVEKNPVVFSRVHDVMSIQGPGSWHRAYSIRGRGQGVQATVLRERRGRGWGEQILEHRESAVLVPEALAQAMSPGAPAAPSAGRGIRRMGGGGSEGAGPRAEG